MGEERRGRTRSSRACRMDMAAERDVFRESECRRSLEQVLTPHSLPTVTDSILLADIIRKMMSGRHTRALESATRLSLLPVAPFEKKQAGRFGSERRERDWIERLFRREARCLLAANEWSSELVGQFGRHRLHH